MTEKVRERSHANKYDKILKENMEFALPGIIKHILGLNVVHSEEIPDDLQHTKERKPDVLKKVTDQNNRTYILHIELQSQNEKDMVYRMAEYRVMLQRQYRLPVKQYVLYIGKNKLTMLSSIDDEDFKFRFNIVTPKQVDYKTFLESDIPEEKILAILADLGDDNPDIAVANIISDVMKNAGGELAENRYINQLTVLANLRNLDLKINSTMSITRHLKLERDLVYKVGKFWGEKEGEEKGMVKGIKKGKIEEKLEIATTMKAMGLEPKIIAKCTKLPVKKIVAL